MEFKPQTLTNEEIPEEVIAELRDQFGNVSIDLDKGIDVHTKSMKSRFVTKDTEIKQGFLHDMDTFQPMVAEGNHGQSYLVRANKTNDGISLRQVIKMDTFEAVGDLTPIYA